MSAVEVVGLDADDTLWHSETLFSMTHERFVELLGDHAPAEELAGRLLDTERRNLGIFGYGAKGFTLSMIETAIEVSGGNVPMSTMQEILDLGKALLVHPVELLPGVEEAVTALADRRLVLITKGDLFHQETKVAGSGLGELFERVEIVSEKDEATYRRVVGRLGAPVDRFVMVGNSLRSDVCPVVAAGGRAVHVPYGVEWALEAVADDDLPASNWWQIDALTELPTLLAELDAGG